LDRLHESKGEREIIYSGNESSGIIDQQNFRNSSFGIKKCKAKAISVTGRGNP
jgi:hypothetical protein